MFDKELVFTVEGYRPGCPEDCKRGIKLRFNSEEGMFLEQFGLALISLFRSEYDTLITNPSNEDLCKEWQTLFRELVDREAER